ncbi:hypothetical protein [Xanthomonas sp. F10]|uniref:hypothetical protein n=1 Tax=Xanthomonas sp. F10 TaxID=3035309 RepID=UPI001620BBC1|nr:hypothetical protein [Xanthomonas sp. F10]
MDTMLTSQAIGKMISTPMICAQIPELSRAANGVGLDELLGSKPVMQSIAKFPLFETRICNDTIAI